MGAIERVKAWVDGQYSSTIGSLRSFWDEHTHHGCFCGAGTRCHDAVDELDRCCAQHDAGYQDAGMSADLMWQVPDGFTKTLAADTKLVECAGRASTWNTEYQHQLIYVFSTRVQISSAISEWLRMAHEAEKRLNRLRDWLTNAVAQGDAIDEGVASHTTELASLGVSGDEVAAIVAELTAAAGSSAPPVIPESEPGALA